MFPNGVRYSWFYSEESINGPISKISGFNFVPTDLDSRPKYEIWTIEKKLVNNPFNCIFWSVPGLRYFLVLGVNFCNVTYWKVKWSPFVQFLKWRLSRPRWSKMKEYREYFRKEYFQSKMSVTPCVCTLLSNSGKTFGEYTHGGRTRFQLASDLLVRQSAMHCNVCTLCSDSALQMAFVSV